MQTDSLAFLRLLQLADSALPIGATAHSFGLETLAAEELLRVEQLEAFLHDYLEETGTLSCNWSQAWRSSHGYSRRCTCRRRPGEISTTARHLVW